MWATRGSEGVSRFPGRTQAAEDALGTTEKPAISLVSLLGRRIRGSTLVVYLSQVKVRGCNAFQYCHVPCTTAAPGEIIVFSIGFHSGCYASWAWMRVVVAAARGRLGLQNLQGGVKAAA